MHKIWLILAGLWLAVPLALAPRSGLAQGAAPTLAPEDRILGKADAPVTIFEYASFTCPHCAAFDQQTLPKLREDWIDPGKAKLVFRDFPFDAPGLHAAMLARCAPPDRFYGFVDVLFREQDSWARNQHPDEALARIARLGGVSGDQYEKCIGDQDLQKRIVAGRIAGEKDYGVAATPTFFINGKKVEGNLPYAEFAKMLDAAVKH
jgi:protein-disulfide isomerase